MKKKTYLFLDNDVYCPEEQTDTFGKEVTIDKKDRDEVWFTFVENKKKGYVVYPNLFAENTPENQIIFDHFIRLQEDIKVMKKSARDLYNMIQPAKL